MSAQGKKDNKDLRTELDVLAHALIESRRLSQPPIDTVENGDGYSRLLKKNLHRIQELAAANNESLNQHIYPLLEGNDSLPTEAREALEALCERLAQSWPEEDLDLTLLFRLRRRLHKDAIDNGDADAIAITSGKLISAAYSNLNRFNRIRTSRELTEYYQKAGLEAAEYILNYLKKENFVLLKTAKARDVVLSSARFYLALYDTWYTTDEETNDMRIDGLYRANALADDPWYVEHAPEYDWYRHRLRTYEHMGQLTECGNQWKLNKRQCERVQSGVEELSRLWHADGRRGEELLPRVHLELIIARNAYFSGRSTLAKYRDELNTLYTRYANEKYDMYSVLANIFFTAEYLTTIQAEDMDEKSRELLRGRYRWIANYILNSRGSDAYSFMLEYLFDFLELFIEIPGEYSFEDMALKCLAALDPPSYVHSMQVAALSRCLMGQLIRTNPEALIGTAGCSSREEVLKRKDELLYTAYHAGLCHDIGKLPIMDTIIIYGRELLDEERLAICQHSSMSAYLLSLHPSTRGYAAVCEAHHRWYDGSDGYPAQLHYSNGKVDMVACVISVAAALDMATDEIGRGYREAISLPRLVETLKAGAGRRYSPQIVALFEDPQLLADIEFLLNEGNEDNYRNTFLFLRGVKKSAGQDYDGRYSLEVAERLKQIKERLEEEEKLNHAYRLMEYDRQTICPPGGQEEAGEVMTALSVAAYRIRKEESFIAAVEWLHERRQQLNEWDRCLVEQLHRNHLRDKNISARRQEIYNDANQKAWIAWNTARNKNDFRLFEAALARRRELAIERVSLWELEKDDTGSFYDLMLDEYERGIDTKALDRLFGESLTYLKGLIKRIADREKQIRTDFLIRRVSDAQQEEMARWLLKLMDFDMERGCMGTSVHPFTENVGSRDVRITTHYEPENFLSSIYSIIHECGHALFEQLQPADNHAYFIADLKTMGQHESVSRFYENIIGRSEQFVHRIYPKLCEIFPNVMYDVNERELYEAVNLVSPSLIRTEADEVSYTLHIIIRYELEREMIDRKLPMAELPGEWNKRYREYLGITPPDDLSGVLQDVHWTDCFGYFPTYALGNYYGAMYLKRMQEDFDPFEAAGAGDFARINAWMKEHVFAKADRLAPADWIYDITGEELSPDAFITYLEKKYSKIYDL